MRNIHDAIEAAINEVSGARNLVLKIRSNQVRDADTVATLKATAHTWFHTHRPFIVANAPGTDLTDPDLCFKKVLEATAKYAAKTTYVAELKNAKKALVAVRTSLLVAPASPATANTDDLAPDFSALAGNQQMRDILSRRWNECARCVRADAHLAAIVMMGGLLEALFVARANRLTDKTQLTAADNAPKEKATGKTINYQEWMLDSYIKVGFELQWITESAKDVADTLKEYRNFIHPAKELRYGVILGSNDSSIFWQVTKALARQLLVSV